MDDMKGCWVCTYLRAIISESNKNTFNGLDGCKYTAYCDLHKKEIVDECDDNAICNEFNNGLKGEMNKCKH